MREVRPFTNVYHAFAGARQSARWAIDRFRGGEMLELLLPPYLCLVKSDNIAYEVRVPLVFRKGTELIRRSCRLC